MPITYFDSVIAASGSSAELLLGVAENNTDEDTVLS
jgi:hypothetical protein